MKNNHGQVLVLFIMLIPVLLIGVACLIDSSYMYYQKNRLDQINLDVITSIKTDTNIDEDEIERLILLNDAKIVNEDISIDKTDTMVNSININNYIYVESIFGKLIGFDEYKIKSSIGVNYNS